MIKKIMTITIAVAMLTACGTSKEEKKGEETAANVQVEFASLIENPAQFVDQDITIEGKVVHVCTHSGKKMFIVGENPDVRLFISAGEELPKFPMELLGSTISVSGHLAITEAGAKMGESEHKEGEMKQEGEKAAEAEASGEACETEAAVAAQPVLAEYVLHYASHQVK